MSRRDGLLIAEQRRSLQRDGYLLVPSLLDEIILAPMRARLDELVHQGLHPDYFPGHRTHGPWRSLSAMWCISAFTPDNGPLRVIPGSHRVDRNPVDALPLGCEMGPHPAEVKFVAPAGSVIFFNGADLWHSGTFNYSPDPRLAVTAALLRGRAPAADLPARPSPASFTLGPVRWAGGIAGGACPGGGRA